MHQSHPSKYILLAILLLGFIQGIIYAAIIPPWWHYDEPGHFEYAWLVANLPTWPKVGQFDPAMRQQLGYSLMNYGWYQIRNFHPDFKNAKHITIGVTQVGGQPVYYFLASLPLRFLHNATIVVQYYAVRSVSFLLFLLIILVVWNALREITPEGHPLRWMVPAFLALLPAFVDTMTAVNNDVASVLAATLFIWASLRVIKRGISLGRFLLLGITIILCYFSKDTSWFTFLLAPFVLILAILRGRFTSAVIGITVITAFVLALIVLQWGNPTGWYQTPSQPLPVRAKSTDSPAGNYIFQLAYPNGAASGQIMQFMDPNVLDSIKGQTVTLGAWMWADQRIQINSPYILFSTYSSGSAYSPQKVLELSTSPKFYQIIFKVPDDPSFGTLYITYSIPPHEGRIYITGVVLARGEYANVPPRFTDQSGNQGIWDGQAFQNLIRNGSAEQAGFRLRPWVEIKFGRLLASHINLPLIVATSSDWQGMRWYYKDTFATLFRTFWASLAGDKVELRGSYANDYIIALTLLGLIGAGIFMWRKRKELQWDIVLLLGLFCLLPWAFAATRGISGFAIQRPLYPWARYADPGIFSTALILCVGWLEWLNLVKARFAFKDALISAVFLGGIFVIGDLATYSAILAFQAEWGKRWWDFLFVLILVFQVIGLWILVYGYNRFISRSSK